MYKVEEKHILRDKTVTYFHKFKNFGQWIEHGSSLIEVANCGDGKVGCSVYDNDECIGCWHSKEYKNANKTKASNLGFIYWHTNSICNV